MEKEQLEQRKAKLLSDLEQFVAQANRQVAAIQGQLQLLDELLAEFNQPEPKETTYDTVS